VIALVGFGAHYGVSHDAHLATVAAVAVKLGGQFGVALLVGGPCGPRSGDHYRVRPARRKGSHGRALVGGAARGGGQQHHLVLVPGRGLDTAGDG
jgi:hypothetical protein